MKKNLILTAVLTAALGLTACAGGNGAQEGAQAESAAMAAEETAAEETAAETAAGTEAVSEDDGETQESSAATEAAAPDTDRAGNSITVPEEVNSIMSLAPATTQILFDLGLQDKVIAVDTNSPMYVDNLSDEVIQFNMMEPDLEQIISAEPDLIFVSNMSSQGGDDIFKTVRDAGICVAEIPTSNTIEDVKLDISFTADCVGMHEEGAALVKEMEDEMEKIAAIGETITEKKTVLFEISPLPYLYSFGKGVYLNEMIELIGAENVLADQEGWLAVTEESAVAANPDVILTNDNYSSDDPAAEILSRTGWENVTAVANEQVAYIDNAASSLPNHHITEALKQMAKAVYPEAYAEME